MNTFGQLFRITSFGESHGACIGVVIDGCPPGLKLTETDIQPDLDRRRPGQSSLTTQRKERDTITIWSGVFEGKTTGHPIMMMAINEDARSEDYEHLKNIHRPSHADAAYESKYGIRDWRGGGRASARITLGWVAAGAIAKKYLQERLGMELLSFVEQVGDVRVDIDPNRVTMAAIETNPVRCPEPEGAQKMAGLIEAAQGRGDSLGGAIRGVIRNVPAGLGEPVFGKLSADLGKAMLSINAVRGFELGSDGTLGGISTGLPITFRVAFKPTATIGKRHDPCVVPRAVPIVDAMAAVVVMDHALRQRAQNG